MNPVGPGPLIVAVQTAQNSPFQQGVGIGGVQQQGVLDIVQGPLAVVQKASGAGPQDHGVDAVGVGLQHAGQDLGGFLVMMDFAQGDGVVHQDVHLLGRQHQGGALIGIGPVEIARQNPGLRRLRQHLGPHGAALMTFLGQHFQSFGTVIILFLADSRQCHTMARRFAAAHHRPGQGFFVAVVGNGFGLVQAMAVFRRGRLFGLGGQRQDE